VYRCWREKPSRLIIVQPRSSSACSNASSLRRLSPLPHASLNRARPPYRSRAEIATPATPTEPVFRAVARDRVSSCDFSQHRAGSSSATRFFSNILPPICKGTYTGRPRRDRILICSTPLAHRDRADPAGASWHGMRLTHAFAAPIVLFAAPARRCCQRRRSFHSALACDQYPSLAGFAIVWHQAKIRTHSRSQALVADMAPAHLPRPLPLASTLTFKPAPLALARRLLAFSCDQSPLHLVGWRACRGAGLEPACRSDSATAFATRCTRSNRHFPCAGARGRVMSCQEKVMGLRSSVRRKPTQPAIERRMMRLMRS